MNDWHERQLAASPSGKQWQNIERRHGSKLVAVEHNAVLQLAAVLIGYREKLPREVLDHQTCHEVFGRVFLRQYKKDRRFLSGEVFGVDGAVKAKHLL